MFPGFSAEGLAFLRKLKRNNRREWFQPRKEIFETQLKAPLMELVEEVNAGLLKFAPDHITDPAKAIYRIYRDTRFSSDKTPYKTHISAIFPPRGFDRHTAAGFYFHISTESVGIAAGAYMLGPEELRAVRLWLAEHHAEFRKAARKPEKLCGKLEGSELSRNPKGFDPEHPASDLIRKKQWLYWVELPLKIAQTPKITEEILKRFRGTAPVIAMLNAPLRQSAPVRKPSRDLAREFE